MKNEKFLNFANFTNIIVVFITLLGFLSVSEARASRAHIKHKHKSAIHKSRKSKKHNAHKVASLPPNKKRLFMDKKSSRCFFLETVHKSKRFGWVNDDQVKLYSRLQNQQVLSSNSSKNVRRVFVPKKWCTYNG